MTLKQPSSSALIFRVAFCFIFAVCVTVPARERLSFMQCRAIRRVATVKPYSKHMLVNNNNYHQQRHIATATTIAILGVTRARIAARGFAPHRTFLIIVAKDGPRSEITEHIHTRSA